MRLADIDNLSETQAAQLALPLRDGGCGLRTHTRAELHRLFVSSALLVAPAVRAATGFSIRNVSDAADIDAGCPFECCLEVCLASLESQNIARPSFELGGGPGSVSWADRAARKMTKKAVADLFAKFDDLPEEQGKREKARVRSCSGVGAQWVAQAPTCHLTQFDDDDMRKALRLRLGKETVAAAICPHINANGVACGAECDAEG